MSLPTCIGSTMTANPSELADSALAKMGTRTNYAVSMDRSGKVWLDREGAEPKGEVIAVTNRKGDPDWLAEEIRFEARARAKP